MAILGRANEGGGQVHHLPGAVEAGADAVARIARWLVDETTDDYPLIVGVTGSVAAGKTTFCAALAQHIGRMRRVETVSTDGFLFPNAELAARGIAHRKGFPESYNLALLSGTLQRARWGPVRTPGYSHARYDVDPALARTIDRPDVILIEGLGLAPVGGHARIAQHLDLLIYIDAEAEDIEAWFLERFMQLWDAAQDDPSSFYARFRTMTRAEASLFARNVWTTINLPNLRDNIVHARDLADIRIRKERDHRLVIEHMVARRRGQYA